MDGPTVFLGIVIIAVTAMVIYMFVDYNKYKEATTSELKQNDADLAKAKLEVDTRVAAEENERKSNVNYIIDKANEANQNLYTRFDNDVVDMKKNLNTLNQSSATMSSVMRVTGGGTTASAGGTVLGATSSGTSVNGRAITELPGSASPNLELLSSVMATNGMTVSKTLKTDKLQLGDKFLLSGVGDRDGNDDWLRLFNKDNKGYYGGLATGKLWVGGTSHLKQNVEVGGRLDVVGQTNASTLNVSNGLNVKGGASEHNPEKWGTHFPWRDDDKNYIRGDTEIRGNTNNIGDLNVGRNATVQGNIDNVGDLNVRRNATIQGRINFGSPNTTDPYYLEKKSVGDASSLRLTINDNDDESLEIWGGSCSAGECTGDGTMKHRFDASGNAEHTGNLSAKTVRTTGIHMPKNTTIQSDGRLHTFGNEYLYILNQKGAIVGKEWGGNGDLQVQGNTWTNGNSTVKGNLTVQGNTSTVGNASVNDLTANRDVFVNRDLNLVGGNNWTIHAPNDNRTSLFIAPTKAYGKQDYNWDKQVELQNNGNVKVNGDIDAQRICTGNICLRGEGNNVIFESRDRTKRIADIGTGWNKLSVYTNADGKVPFFYVNQGKGFGMFRG